MEAGDMSTTTNIPQNDKFPQSSDEVLDSVWIPNSIHGPASSMVKLDGLQQENDEDHHHQQQPAEKKRRLSYDQVHFLEKSFEVENKLEPHRKLQLAQKLGLHPRQVSIWFQNRRARCKTKQIEKDFVSLRAAYDQLSADFSSLSKDNEKLRNEVRLLRERLKIKEEGAEHEQPLSCQQESVAANNAAILADEKTLSARSDILDSSSSDSPNYYCCNNNNNNDDNVFGSPEDEDENFFHSLSFPKLDNYELQNNNSNFGFPIISDHLQTPCLWNSGFVE